MAGSDLVAIITRTKNRPLLLKRAIQSIQQQTYLNYIHIIINDGGDVTEIINLLILILGDHWSTKCIIETINSDGHMEAASNAGLVIAQTRKAAYITLHDDDDTWSPEFLSIMIREFHLYEKLVPTVKGIVCQSNQVYERIEGNIITIDHLEAHAPHMPDLGILKLSNLLDSNQNFGVNQFLYRTTILKSLKGYDPIFPVLGDWEFNLRFLQQFDIAIIPNYLAFYHRRVGEFGSNANSGVEDTQRKLQWNIACQIIQNRHLREGSIVGLLMNLSFTQIQNQLYALQDQVATLEKIINNKEVQICKKPL